MSRREKEKKASLEALGRIVDKAASAPWLEKPKPAPVPRPPPPAAPRAPPAPATPKRQPARRSIDPRFEGRKAKLEEERILRERRERELHRSQNLEWRGMSLGDVPAGIRRTAWDRHEPSVDAKIGDVLGTPREKDGRVKHREKGRRQ